MAFLANEKEIAKFFKKTALNPNLSFLIYFLLVATYGFIGRELMLFYAVVAPMVGSYAFILQYAILPHLVCRC